MKKFTTLALTLALSMSMAMPAFAAVSVSTENDTVKIDADAVQSDAKIEKVEIKNIEPEKVEEAKATINEATEQFKEAAKDSNKDLTITEITTVDVDIKFAAGEDKKPVTLTFDLGTVELKDNEEVWAVHVKDDGTTELLPAVPTVDGKFSVKFNSFSPVSFIKVATDDIVNEPVDDEDEDDDNDTSANDGTKSPKTGANVIYFAELLAALSLAGAAVCAKRARD